MNDWYSFKDPHACGRLQSYDKVNTVSDDLPLSLTTQINVIYYI